MRSSYLIPCLVLILMNVHSGFSRMKSRNNKPPINKKPGFNVPKPNPGLKPGQLLFRGNRLSLYFNMTEESQVYSANYSMFPDGLYYPRPSTVNDYKEFLSSCLNTTLDLEANKDKISRLRSDIYTKMTLSVVGFLCSENFYSGNNSADLYPGGLWVVTTVSAILLVVKTIG